jgi:hypothetical protein
MIRNSTIRNCTGKRLDERPKNSAKSSLFLPPIFKIIYAITQKRKQIKEALTLIKAINKIIKPNS